MSPSSTAISAAHPRSRGENVLPAHNGHAARGSSPLTRGKHRRHLPCLPPSRLIPAHAGKTLTPGSCPSDTSAHPRSRGENAACPKPRAEEGGSSPLTRGKQLVGRDVRPVVRLIPAHAGKTRIPVMVRRLPWAHPRSRGENPDAMMGTIAWIASSPLTRGKPQGPRGDRRGHRLIPAHAGKTPGGRRGPAGTAAHPRSRGENVSSSRSSRSKSGSSPLTRGKLVRRDRAR